MRIAKVSINNFRGISSCELVFPPHSVAIIGDNNVGKSTILEAIDLVLGPERLSRRPVIDEHDFYAGKYLDTSENQIEIKIEVIIAELNDEQKAIFNAHLEWWNSETKRLVDETSGENIKAALQVCFIGRYDIDDDDFVGGTYFSNPFSEENNRTKFTLQEKRKCGFLYLRALRTGTRALSLQKGSLLDIILQLKDIRPNMWENVLSQLRQLPVADNPEIGLTGIFTNLQEAIKKFVPAEWGSEPHLRVSDLTRENLRNVLTAFISTGASGYSAPFHHQGTGTINMLVLALLSMIAEEKQNVIFAMEEPEIAIPPYAQKRIIDSLSAMSAQAIFTSHSPFVIEEFEPENVLVLQRDLAGLLIGKIIELPPSIKYKRYRQDFRGKFAEALLSRRVLITEGATEASAYSAAARKLAEMNAETYSSLESLGLAVCNAGSDSQIINFGKFLREFGKETFAVFDLQSEEAHQAIQENVDYTYMSPFRGMEKLVTEQSAVSALKRFMNDLINNGEWTGQIRTDHPNPMADDDSVKNAMFDYFRHDKGDGRIADFLICCAESEMPNHIKETIQQIKLEIIPRVASTALPEDVHSDDITTNQNSDANGNHTSR